MMHKCARHRSFSLLIVFTVLSAMALSKTGAAGQLHLDGLSAKDIIKHMNHAYGTSNSYSDSGVVQIVFINVDGRRTVEKSFKTAFIRPNRFRL